MATKQRSTIVGVFEDRRHADQAVADLKHVGFRDDQIGVAMRHGEDAAVDTDAEATGSHAESGAITGVLAGLGLGALAGLGVLSGVIPVIGPAIAAGTLGVLFSNAAIGAGVAGLAGALIGAGVPEKEAHYYHGEFEAGRIIVTVTADTRADEASAILRRYGAYDMSTRDTATTSQVEASTPMTGKTMKGATTRAASRDAGDTIEVKEERLHAEKRPVETGEVRVRKEVHTETKTIDVPVEREEIVIERTPVRGRAAKGTVAGDLREGEELRIPVREEQVSVTKEAVVIEEVKVGKRTVQDTERVSGQVRKEEVKIEREGDVKVHNRGTDKNPK